MTSERTVPDDVWSVGTFGGLRRAQARSIAALTPQQRFDWLHSALDLAAGAGTLARLRAARGRAATRTWTQ